LAESLSGSEYLHDFALSPNGERLLCSAEGTGEGVLYELSHKGTDAQARCASLLAGEGFPTILMEEDQILCAGDRGPIHVLDQNLLPKEVLSILRTQMGRIARSNDGRFVEYAFGEPGQVWLHEGGSGVTVVRTLATHEGGEGLLALAKEAPKGVSTHASGDMAVMAAWDLSSDRPHWQQPMGEHPICALCLAHNGELIYALSDRGMFLVIEHSSGTIVDRRFLSHRAPGAMALSPDGETLALAQNDQLSFFQVAQRECVRTLTIPGARRGSSVGPLRWAGDHLCVMLDQKTIEGFGSR
jgi:hypothetical protein